MDLDPRNHSSIERKPVAPLLFEKARIWESADYKSGNGEALAERASKMQALGNLACGIAHDFNNILTPILLRTEMAMAQLEQDSPVQYHLEQILTCGRRARDLVQQIATFSHPKDEDRGPLQLSLVVKEILKFLRSSMPATVEIRQDIRGNGFVLADLSQIHMLLMELCVWPGQPISGRKGLLQVELSDIELNIKEPAPLSSLPKGGYVKLSVKREIQDFPKKTREKTEGDPDLCLIGRVVELHGGKLVVDKKISGNTDFHVFFPRMKSKAPAKGTETTLLSRGSEKILLVDDEQVVVEAFKQVLTHLGYTVVSTTNSAEALKIFCNAPDMFDVLITDQTMPVLTGLELAAEVRRIRPEIPIILCSGFGEIIQGENNKKADLGTLLRKPFTAHDIARRVREVLNGNG